MVEYVQVLYKGFEEMGSHSEEQHGETSKTYQRLAALQLQAQQPRLAAKADVKQDMKNRAREEDANPDERL